MKHIFVANPKGGCGKTTLSAQLAAYWSEQGLRVALVDHDCQQSASDWLKARPQACEGIVPIAAYRQQLLPEDGDLAIHDMPAACPMAELERQCTEGCHLLIPILPSPTDIKAGVRFLMNLNREPWLQDKHINVGLVANRVRSNTNYYKVLVAFLEQVNMPLVASIRDTQNYIRAMDRGVSIFDLPPSRVAKDREQWQPLLDWLQVA